MREAGSALMGIGVAQGENRAIEAARAAISSPLLETSLDGATGILLNITGGPDLGLAQVDEAAQVVTARGRRERERHLRRRDRRLDGRLLRVTAIATGFGGASAPATRRRRGASSRCARRSRRRASPDVEIDIPSFLKED